MVEIPSVNYLAVLVGALVYYLLGAVWYSFLFRDAWIKGTGKTMEQLKQGMSPAAAMSMMAVVTFVSVMALGWLMAYSETTDLAGALAIAVIVSFGFLLVPLAAGMFYEGRSFTFFLVNFGYHTTGTILAAIVLGLWP